MTTTTSNAGRKNILTSMHGRQVGLGPLDLTNLPQGAQPLVIRGEASAASFSAAPGAANVTNITIQLTDNEGNNVAGVHNIDWWLSDAATGIGVTGTTASGAVGAGSAGTDLAVLVTKKMTKSQTDATGKYVAQITDTGKTAFYIAVVWGRHDAPRVSAVLAAGNYG